MELDRLIETERLNDDRVRRAVEEAAAIVRAAREAAQQREAGLAAELHRIVTASAAAVAAERERRIAGIVASARNTVARYAAVTEVELATVAQTLVHDLIVDLDAV